MAVLSNLVSNVPAVLVLRPFVDAPARPDTAWLLVAMASTLAGNFTVLGSIANLIVVQIARSRGVVDRLLGLLQGRRPADRADHRHRDALAIAVTRARGRTPPWRSRPRPAARSGESRRPDRAHRQSLDALYFLLAGVRGTLAQLRRLRFRFSEFS